MKKVFCLVLGLALIQLANAQITPRLAKALEAEPQAFHPVSVTFYSAVDIQALQQKHDLNNTPAGHRAREVNQLLTAQAEKSQAQALSLLAGYSQDLLSTHRSFYIVNMIIMQAKAPVIEALAELAEVQELDLSVGQIEFDQPVSFSGKRSSTGATGTEPGLVAINAPAMWALGYTGRGQKVYIYDSGVWPNHPAFSDRFMGNFSSLQSSWYGYFLDEPSGANSDHGTHVLGTVAGLDLRTNDTIGVAYGSYWLACDLINASTAAGLPSQAELIGAFQWALNPDGDINTSDDIPAVINNSWRWRDIIDTAECGGFIPQLMNTIEAAGIANIFSGGNTGPSNTGVNSPQRINTSEVNTFSVGSINGNQPFPQPISGFSTRGPTQCPGTGSLKIHPEVVAPGQNVRSAWGQDGFNTISGTSMSSPHVSGAVLLLKEAFPTLSGNQLLQALYNSAIDMGPVGEDNTYGKGLIDVHAAYLLLAQSHSPVSPQNIKWDLALTGANLPLSGNVTCDTLYSPVLELTNLGDSAITSVDIDVFRNGVVMNTTPITFSTPGLNAKGTKQTINLNALKTIDGHQEWSFRVSTGKQEYDLVNNQRFVRFYKLGAGTIPFTEDFENGIDANTWFNNNEDDGLGWKADSLVGWSGNHQAAWLNWADYFPRENQKDGLWSPRLNLPVTATSLRLAFDLAYQSRGPISSLQDTLRVLVSTDCGSTFTTLYEKWGNDLSSTGQSGGGFKPSGKSDFRRDTIDLLRHAGQEIILSFQGTNRNGNNVYLDNISVYAGAQDPLRVEDLNRPEIHFYPNPVKRSLHIAREPAFSESFSVTITDVSGKIMFSDVLEPFENAVNVAALTKGMYIINVKHGHNTERATFVKV